MWWQNVNMELQLQIKLNPNLYLRDPESSTLGKNIVRHSVELIDELGFEDFTFKKLAQRIDTTEAGIYRYFENKHKLLIYLTTWFWTWMEYQIMFQTNNIADSKKKIDTIIALLSNPRETTFLMANIDKEKLNRIVVAEGNKAYLTKHVTEDNKAMLFAPYKDLCHKIASVFADYAPGYPYPHSLASTLVETAHHQMYFKDNLPRLTDFGPGAGDNDLAGYLSHLMFGALNAGK